MFRLKFEQRRDCGHRSDQGTRLAAAEGGEPIKAQFERPALNAPEQAGDIARERVVDIADEAQREMIVLRIDPARPGQTAAHYGQ